MCINDGCKIIGTSAVIGGIISVLIPPFGAFCLLGLVIGGLIGFIALIIREKCS
jgi:hypothetical protein